jgi:hypothetical protein
MNQLSIFTLKAMRKLYAKAFRVQPLPKPACEQDPDKVSRIIYDKLMSDQPCMIGRLGSTELNMMVNYLGVKQVDKSILKFIQGKTHPWWWDKNRMLQMQRWSGFFSPTPEKTEQFCELMLEDMKEVDVLGSWIPQEHIFRNKIEKSSKVKLVLLEPYTCSNPWSRSLKGKRMLVIHPFAELIEKQYQKRELLFKDKDVLPQFQLQTIKAVQSLGGIANGFEDWFEALDYMKSEISKREFDICLIGCGAYGFPLAAHVKRMGKKAVHLGGALQLLFGIKGNRWEDINYAAQWGLPHDTYLSMFNDNWVKPDNELKPANAKNVEGACYW